MNRIVYLLVLVTSVTGIVYTGVTGNPIVGAGICAVVMTFYLLWIISRKKQGEALLDMADSFYYLGFILTLVSLGMSLVGMKGAAEATINDVLYRFGLGLFATLYGLAGRVALTQFRFDYDLDPHELSRRTAENAQALAFEMEKGVRSFSGAIHKLHTTVVDQHEQTFQELSQLVRKCSNSVQSLSDEVSRSEDLLRQLNVKVHSELKDLVPAMQSTMRGQAEVLLEELRSSTKIAAERFAEGASRISSRMEEVSIPSEELTKRLLNGVADLERALVQGGVLIEKAIGNLVGNVAKLDIPSDTIKDKLVSSTDAVVLALERSATQLHLAGEKLVSRINDIEVPGQTIAAAIDEARVVLQLPMSNLQKTIRVLQDQTESFVGALETLASRAHGASSSLQETILSTEKVKISMTSLQNMSEIISDLGASMSTAMQRIVVAIDNLQRHANNAKDATEDDMNRARAYRTQIEDEVKAAIAATSRIHQSLVDNTQFIISKLGK